MLTQACRWFGPCHITDTMAKLFLQDRFPGDVIQCLKTPGEALPLMATLQHDNWHNRQKRAGDFKQICQQLYKHSIKLMGSSWFISLARQVGKWDRSSCTRRVGRGEEAEKGDVNILGSLFLTSPCANDTIIICVGRIKGGYYIRDSSLIPQKATLGSTEEIDTALGSPCAQTMVSKAVGSDTGLGRWCPGSPSLCALSSSHWNSPWGPLPSCFSNSLKAVGVFLSSSRAAHHSTTMHTFYVYSTPYQCSSPQSLS